MVPEVLHLCECYVGGVRTHIDLVLPELRSRGIAVEAWLSTRRDADAERCAEALAAQGVPVRSLALSRGVAWREDRRARRELASWVAAHPRALVHSHGAKAGLLARRVALPGSATRLHMPHGFAFRKAAEFGALRRALIEKVERALAPRTELLLAVSEDEARAARSLGFAPERVRVLRHGVRTPALAELRSREHARAQLGLPRQGLLLLVAGILMREKGQELALRALAEDVAGSWTLALVGAGPREGALRALAARLGLGARVRFVGAVRELAPWVDACDLALLPSHSEGFPYVALEVLARARPLLASAVGGLPELWSEAERRAAERAGVPLLLATREVRTWASALAAWGAASAAREELGALGRARVEASFALATQVEALVSLYRELASRHAAERR
ncbi:MAG: glycosyltransferase [Planctomycetes bacterium]|nr:glycosyltransferase [Planctomycetota bacterium]